MEYLLGFVFTLFKITIQASCYATAARWLAQLADARQVNNALVRASRLGKQFWRRSFVVAYAALFLFSCTYWGDHGLGDSARVPVGRGEVVEEINGIATYFEPLSLPSGAPLITSFQAGNDRLCGLANDGSFFVYDLALGQQHLFADSQEYTNYAAHYGLPAVSEFRSFREQYSRYWSGWRFWLLA